MVQNLKTTTAIATVALSQLDIIRIEIARRDFLEFRKLMHPKLKIGWFVNDLCLQFQRFYEDFISGLKPVLILCTPPQHGKSEATVDFIAWILGKHPELKTIFASFSDSLSKRSNKKLQRMIHSGRYRQIFPELRTALTALEEEKEYARTCVLNTTQIDFVGAEAGVFKNTTVQGSVTGENLDLGIIDDPIKGREAAKSELIRNKTWEWFTDDFFTRFSEDAAFLMILTRWHIDDPAGRLMLYDKSVRVVSYKAIADNDEKHRKAGEPLFPEHKSLEFLMKRKLIMPASNWLALYQQTPIISGGDLIKTEGFEIVQAAPAHKEFKKLVRYWDKAGTKDGGAYTAGVLMGVTNDNIYYVLDVIRGQWSALDRSKKMKQAAENDPPRTNIWVEQEPGSGGKESAENTLRELSGHRVYAERVTGDKVYRAEPYAAQVEAGNVKIVKAEWNKTFIEEHEMFPNGKYKDQVDASSGAFNKLALTRIHGYTEEQINDIMNSNEKTTIAPSFDSKDY